MKAVIKEKPGPGFVLREIPPPQANPGTVVVQVKAVGICGSDLPIFSGVRSVPYPLIPGHEFAGIIAQVGPGVKEWQIGDRVAVGLVMGCGKCSFCRRGQEELCDHLAEIGIHADGAYAEYVRVPVANLHHLPEEVSFHQGASADPLASSYHGLRRLNIRPEDNVVLFGDGAISLYALQAVQARGVKRAMVIGHHDRRLQVAAELGAVTVNSHQQDPVEIIARLTGGRMADLVIEATGNAEVLPILLRAAAKGGTVLLLGIFHFDAQVNPAPIIRHELHVVGSFCYNYESFAASLELLRHRQVRIEPVVTHILPLEEIGHALDLLNQRQAIKVILEPGR